MPANFNPGTQPPSADDTGWWFPFAGRQLLVAEGTEGVQPLYGNPQTLGLTPEQSHYLGQLRGRPCYGALVATPPASGQSLRGLRDLYGCIDDDLLGAAGVAFQVMEWERTHRFCGHCGTPTQAAAAERAKRCPACGLSQYPRISPAMIVLISHGDRLLLGRAPRFRPGMYSLIAGYVESGESLEECVVREVKEEVGVKVANIRYWGSQPWPFPHTLMVGFTATYAGGDIVLADQELVDARWFSVDQLPELPGGMSIARKMIEWFVRERR